jgi:hypothetical protein
LSLLGSVLDLGWGLQSLINAEQVPGARVPIESDDRFSLVTGVGAGDGVGFDPTFDRDREGRGDRGDGDGIEDREPLAVSGPTFFIALDKVIVGYSKRAFSAPAEG